MLKKIINIYFFKIIIFPFSILYGLVSAIRNYLYDTNIIKPKHLTCKVISVGNITTGGSGKTPTVEFLAHYLKSIGKNVGIISRGYGRVSKNVVVVTDGKTKPLLWEKFGDEAFLLSNKLDDIPIIVAKINQPTLSATSFEGKNLLIITAYIGTIPPWDKPKHIATIYNDNWLLKGRNIVREMACKEDPKIRVWIGPILSERKPKITLLATAANNIKDKISVPTANP